VTTVHVPFDTRIFHKECVSLAEAGYDVHLVARHDREEVVSGVRVHALPTPASRPVRILGLPWLARRRVLSIRPRPALVHVHDPELLPVARSLRRLGIVCLFDVHESIADQMLDKPYLDPRLRRLAAGTWRRLERPLLADMPTVHVLESIAQRYPEPKVVVRNLPILSGDGPVRSPRLGLNDPPVLLYLGSINELRGGLMMIQAAEALRRRGRAFRLRLVGPVERARTERRIRQAVRSAGLEQTVELAGPMPFAAARREVASADLGLCLFLPMPNTINSLPNKLLEYQAAGLPVVASDFEAWRPYVVDTGGGVQADPCDPENVAEVIDGLLANPERIARMSRGGAEAVREKYRWELEKDNLLAFYRRLLGEESA
jgi:glycosyltransferase involved in cell wall biosynthesis